MLQRLQILSFLHGDIYIYLIYVYNSKQWVSEGKVVNIDYY